MIQFLIPGIGGYLTLRILYRNEIKYKKLVKELSENNIKFKNSGDLKVTYIDVNKTDFSDRLILNISKVLGYEDFINQKDYLLSYFKCRDILFKKLDNNLVQLDIIKEKLDPGEYKLVPQKEYELYCGINQENKPELINMNSFPHLIIGGDTGSGKSRFLMMMLTNLIANCNNVDLYLLQIRKSDLIVFKNCKQTKYIARSLNQALKLLKYVDNLCSRRDKIIEEYTLSDGIYNIEDWNKHFRSKKMKYSYIVLDEFAFFNPNGSDTKEIKEIKKEILGYIKNIVLVGRSVGVFVITSLQKPTSTSIPSDIKSQLTTRVAFKLKDIETSVIVLGNGNASKIDSRECIVRTLDEVRCKSQFIDHNIITSNIDKYNEKIKEYILLNVDNPLVRQVVTVENEGALNETKEVKEEIKEEVKETKKRSRGKKGSGVIDTEVLKDVLNNKV